MARRGIAPVVGVALMIVITLLLATIFAISFVSLGDFSDEDERVDDLLNDQGSSPYNSGSDLIPVKSPSESPRTSGDNVLEFRIENTRDEQVTIEGFEIDATGIDSGIVVDDSPSADEVEIRRVSQNGGANRGSDSFDADGTQYHLDDDSTAGGQVAILDPDEDDAEVDIREFSQTTGDLEFADSEESADLTVYLTLDDGSKHGFFFRQR